MGRSMLCHDADIGIAAEYVAEIDAADASRRRRYFRRRYRNAFARRAISAAARRPSLKVLPIVGIFLYLQHATSTINAFRPALSTA